jgi:hypothetical protein
MPLFKLLCFSFLTSHPIYLLQIYIGHPTLYNPSNTMVKIKSIEYFRVLPRWLFVKVTDEEGQYGWGESTLEGHTEAVEGTLNALCKRFVGYEAE